MDCQSNEKGCSFIWKRSLIIRQNRMNRREQIFNRTRMILIQSQNLESINNDVLQQASTDYSIFTKQHMGQSLEQQISQQPVNILQSKYKQKSHHSKKHHGKRPTKQYYKNFQFPEWLVNLSSFSSQNLKQFYFCLRPQGQRVFIYIKKSVIQVISMYGKVIHKIGITKSGYNKTLLEGYYLKQEKMVFVSDLIVWKQNPMSSSQFQFRLAWLISNFGQNVIDLLLFSPSKTKLKIISYLNVNRENFVEVLTGQNKLKMNYPTDGVLFYHKDSFYIHGEVNSEFVLWKDQAALKMINNSNYSGNKQIIYMVNHSQLRNQKDQFISQELQDESFLKGQDTIQCQSQMKILSIRQKIISFYGYLNLENKLLLTLQLIPLVKFDALQDITSLVQHNRQYSCSNKNPLVIAKFTFKQIRIQDNMTRLTQPKILSVYEVNHRIPDCLSKILWKWNFIKNENNITLEDVMKIIEKANEKKGQMSDMMMQVQE